MHKVSIFYIPGYETSIKRHLNTLMVALCLVNHVLKINSLFGNLFMLLSHFSDYIVLLNFEIDFLKYQ